VAALRIAYLGGVPPSLGGGGLETQLAETIAAVQRTGNEAFHVAHEPRQRPFDLLHAIGSEPDICHWLTHWRRNPAPFVVSPVLVVAPGRERRERLAARVPLASFGPRMRADLLRRADLVVAQTAHEARLATQLGARQIVSIPNGVAPLAPAALPFELPRNYVLFLGTVNRRKHQAEAIAALGGQPSVVAGGFEGTSAERAHFESTVARAGGMWLGEITDPVAVRALVREARALLHLSRAEGQSLALLEALSEGTPIVASRLPGNVELAERHPEHVHLVDGAAEAAAVVAGIRRPNARPDVPTWDDVAAQLVRRYEELVG
jgi:glycosyltransferase involved in cell wall biosynthesis